MKSNNLMLEIEGSLLDKGYKLIAGVDEAGRGPLAGPVVSAAVIMPLNEEDIIVGVNDSKKLSEKKRLLLYEEIIKKAVDYSVKFIDEEVIDDINILNATKLSMKECVLNLKVTPDIVLLDAVKIDLPMRSESIISGDALSYSIACASIIAKVERDIYMQMINDIYPEYNFAKHKGYGTKEHIENIKKHGACKIHRQSFLKNTLKG